MGQDVYLISDIIALMSWAKQKQMSLRYSQNVFQLK